MTARPLRLAPLLATLALAGCSTLSSWIPSIPVPSLSSISWMWGGGTKKLGPLPEISATATAQAVWQVPVGKAAPGLAPAVLADAIYAAATDGTVVRVDPATGRTAWRIAAGKRLAAGVGVDPTIVVVGTDKGDVLAFDPDGKSLWTSRVSSEVVSPPDVAEGIVAVWSGDGRLYGLSSADGKTKWVYQRANPPLTVRNYAGGVISRGGVFVGTAGGKLIALDLATGRVGWEGSVATPRGATELERIADVTSLPVIEPTQACAVAFQGRVACFEITRGTLVWSRDISSLEGIVVDNRHLYVTDDRSTIHALDKTTGATVWKQELLKERRPGGPQIAGDFVAVVDGEGYVHLLDRNNGKVVGRMATDGSPATSQPAASAGNAVFLSTNGKLFAVTGR